MSLLLEEQELRDDILSLCRDWRKKYPCRDIDGKWSGRLMFAFRWPQARRQIDNLITDRRLDIQKIGLDIPALKKARDTIAHSGRLPDFLRNNREVAIGLLKSAQFGLQVLLLAELGYTDLVQGTENGWKTLKPMSEYLLAGVPDGTSVQR